MERTMKRRLAAGAAVLAGAWLAAVATAGTECWVVYPTLPGTTVRDFTQPGAAYEVDGRGDIFMYPTEPGMSIPSLSEPGVIIERERGGRTVVYPTVPGTRVRDYWQPGYVIEER